MIRTFLTALQRFDRNEMLTPYGIFLLRITLAAIWIAHFWFKVGYKGMPATVAFFELARLSELVRLGRRCR